jgi:RNA 3'-phosphate cyclase
MLEIDGSKKSGSGTILRLAISLASILGDELHIYNIRKKRRQPGLRPQHLEAVITAGKLCNAEIEGATLNSQELWFHPGQIIGGSVKAEIGTAGSIPMLLLTILPICAFAKKPVQVHVSKGGTDVRHAPTINYLQHVLLPTLAKMGLRTSLEIQKYGYYPKGMGEIVFNIYPCPRLSPLQLEVFGNVELIQGISVCTFLKKRRVAERQAHAAQTYLESAGFSAAVDVVYDVSNPLQRGSSIVLWTETNTSVLLGGDAIGERGKPSEIVGKTAAKKIFTELEAKATVDVHLADMLIPYVALTAEASIYFVRSMTTHLETNVWLTQTILETPFQIEKVGDLYKIEKKKS